MPWGKVDDSFYDHPKLDRLGKDRLAAVGLHWLAISWCNRYLTDGAVPTDRVRRLGGTIKLAEALVHAELRETTPDGYQVHDFGDFNPSRADVEANREAERLKKRRQRSAGAGKAEASGAVAHDPDTGRYATPMSPGDTPGASPSTRPSPVPSHPRALPNGSAPSAGAPADDEATRHGLPHVTEDVWVALERVVGRSRSTLHGTWAGLLDRLVEQRSAPRVIAAVERSSREYSEPPSWAQIVASIRNDLEPLPGSKRQAPVVETEAERFARERAELLARMERETSS